MPAERAWESAAENVVPDSRNKDVFNNGRSLIGSEDREFLLQFVQCDLLQPETTSIRVIMNNFYAF